MPGMKRMGRWLFNLAAGVVLVAATAGWIRSYFAFDSLDLGYRSGTQWHITSCAGRIGVMRTVYVFPIDRSSAMRWEHRTIEAGMGWGNSGWEWGGFDVTVNTQRFLTDLRPVSKTVTVIVPYWFLVLGASIFPLLSLVRSLRERRRLKMAGGLCLQCGYDLRATPDRCPECGAIAPKKAAISN
jgi:hypothetical protein